CPTAASASARRSASAGATSTSTRGLHVRQQLSRRRVPKQLKTPAAQLSLHSLRHTFASLLIAKGLDVVFVSRQLGHASPAVTLRVPAPHVVRPAALTVHDSVFAPEWNSTA